MCCRDTKDKPKRTYHDFGDEFSGLIRYEENPNENREGYSGQRKFFEIFDI